MRAALIFDLDGTLVDTVYAHVFAWQRAFAEAGMPIDGWRIHRRVGMSGGLFARAAAREIGREFSIEEAEALQQRHGELFRELLPERRPLPGAVQLLADLRAAGVLHGIATSGRRPEIDSSLEALGVGPDLVVVERGDVELYEDVVVRPGEGGKRDLDLEEALRIVKNSAYWAWDTAPTAISLRITDAGEARHRRMKAPEVERRPKR